MEITAELKSRYVQQPPVPGPEGPSEIRRGARVQRALTIHLGERLVGVHVLHGAQLPFARLVPVASPQMIE